MEFGNEIVGGSNELVREAIQSRGFVDGVSGWRVDRAGNAQFNNIVVRGSFSTGVAPNARVSIDNTVEATPSIQFYSSGITSGGYVRSYIRSAAGETTAVGLEMAAGANSLDSDRRFQLFLDNGGWKIGYHAQDSINRHGVFIEGVQDKSGGAGFWSLSMGLKSIAPEPVTDTRISMSDGLIQTIGADILLKGLNTASRVVDGKFVGVASSVTSATTTPVTVPSANAQSVPVVLDKAYRVLVLVSFHSTIAGDRAQFQLWDGTVGVTALGQTQNRKCNTAVGVFENQVLMFTWRATSTQTIANLNLSVARLSGTGTVTAQTDANYAMIVEEVGNASVMGGL